MPAGSAASSAFARALPQARITAHDPRVLQVMTAPAAHLARGDFGFKAPLQPAIAAAKELKQGKLRYVQVHGQDNGGMGLGWKEREHEVLLLRQWHEAHVGVENPDQKPEEHLYSTTYADAHRQAPPPPFESRFDAASKRLTPREQKKQKKKRGSAADPKAVTATTTTTTTTTTTLGDDLAFFYGRGTAAAIDPVAAEHEVRSASSSPEKDLIALGIAQSIMDVGSAKSRRDRSTEVHAVPNYLLFDEDTFETFLSKVRRNRLVFKRAKIFQLALERQATKLHRAEHQWRQHARPIVDAARKAQHDADEQWKAACAPIREEFRAAKEAAEEHWRLEVEQIRQDARKRGQTEQLELPPHPVVESRELPPRPVVPIRLPLRPTIDAFPLMAEVEAVEAEHRAATRDAGDDDDIVFDPTDMFNMARSTQNHLVAAFLKGIVSLGTVERPTSQQLPASLATGASPTAETLGAHLQHRLHPLGGLQYSRPDEIFTQRLASPLPGRVLERSSTSTRGGSASGGGSLARRRADSTFRDDHLTALGSHIFKVRSARAGGNNLTPWDKLAGNHSTGRGLFRFGPKVELRMREPRLELMGPDFRYGPHAPWETDLRRHGLGYISAELRGVHREEEAHAGADERARFPGTREWVAKEKPKVTPLANPFMGLGAGPGGSGGAGGSAGAPAGRGAFGMPARSGRTTSYGGIDFGARGSSSGAGTEGSAPAATATATPRGRVLFSRKTAAAAAGEGEQQQ